MMMSRRHRHALIIPPLKFRVLRLVLNRPKPAQRMTQMTLILMEFPPKILQIFHAQNTHKRTPKNGFPLPNLQRLSLGRVPSRDKRSRGLRFHRNRRVILLGRDREGLLRLSIVHRVGVLSGMCNALLVFLSRLSSLTSFDER